MSVIVCEWLNGERMSDIDMVIDIDVVIDIEMVIVVKSEDLVIEE